MTLHRRRIDSSEWTPADIEALEDNALVVVRSDDNRSVIAGPGAGKTELLVHAISGRQSSRTDGALARLQAAHSSRCRTGNGLASPRTWSAAMMMNLEMPTVEACAVMSCAYNVDRNCHARAITVGEGVHPGCDTFFPSDRHTGELHRTAGVGACKVTICRHNTDFECGAEAIRVTVHENHADCATFAPR